MNDFLKDSRPIYLGFCKEHKKYCFYAIKDGKPRFLSYVSYFYWDLGPQTALSFTAVPEILELELEQFLKGTLTYEFFKRRKNSKSQDVRKIFRLPSLVEGDGEVPFDPLQCGARKSGNSIRRSEIPERQDSVNASTSKRLRRPKLPESTGSIPDQSNLDIKVEVKIAEPKKRRGRQPKVVEPLLVPVPVVTPTTKKRGRPFKIKV